MELPRRKKERHQLRRPLKRILNIQDKSNAPQLLEFENYEPNHL